MVNKKGNVLDWFVILVVLLIFVITLFASYIIIDSVDNIEVFTNNTVANNAMTSARNTILSFDNLMLFVIVGLSLFVVISSAVIFNHPAFFIAGTFLLFIAVTLAGIISNTFWTFRTSENVAATAALFPKITFLMEKLPIYILALGMAGVIVMYVAYNRQ